MTEAWPIEQITLSASGYTFDALAAGPPDGEPVLLLHGMPETNAMWIGVIEHLTALGYRCVAPNQRGYSEGARPKDVAQYSHAHLADDVLQLATAAGFARFNLVAHDWGAAIGWCAVDVDGGRRINSYTALSIPHYRGFAEATRDDPAAQFYRDLLEQMKAPGHNLVDAWLADEGAGLRASWYAHDEDLTAEYWRVLGAPGALDAVLNWYRASDGHMNVLEGTTLSLGDVSIPTMLIYGNQDIATTRWAVDAGRRYIKGPHEVFELEAGHWLTQEEPEIIPTLIARQLSRFPVFSPWRTPFAFTPGESAEVSPA